MNRKLARIDAARLQRLEELAQGLDTSTLYGHFHLGRASSVAPPAWSRWSLAGWDLSCDERLPVLDVLGTDEEMLGWMIGHPLDLAAGAPARNAVRAPFPAVRAPSESEIEQWLDGFAGRFALILLRPLNRIYVDAAASLPVLFHREAGTASSSPFLLTPLDEIRDGPLVSELAVAETDRWFIFGTSPLAGANRLLPNHFLDLGTWEMRRRWPQEAFERIAVDTVLDAVIDKLEATMRALTFPGTPPPNLAITSGFDSRTLLACSRAVVDRLNLFTVAWPDDYGAADKRTAPRVAALSGAGYRKLEWQRPTPGDVERFMVLTGAQVGERRGRFAGPTWNQLGPNGAFVSGVTGEAIAGGSRPGDSPGMHLSRAELIGRCFGPSTERLESLLDEWLAELPPGLDSLDVITLFTHEMAFGCWGGALTTAYPDAYSHTVYPFGHRGILDAVLRLPLDYRVKDTLRADIIARRWPELLVFPFNRKPRALVARRAAVNRGRRILRPLRRKVRTLRSGRTATPGR